MKEIQGQSFLQNHPCYNKAASANWGAFTFTSSAKL